MHLARLGDGGVLIYSPSWVGPSVFDQVEAHGTPRLLVIPNHFHNLAIRRFRERYPEARVVAHTEALPRLRRKGHERIDSIETARDQLSPHLELVTPEGTKNGEIWLLERGAKPELAIGDAFFNLSGPLTGLVGWFMRVAKGAPGLCIGQTYRWVGLQDEPLYKRWLIEWVQREQPQTIHFCHGVALTGPGTPKALIELARRRLKG